MQCPHCGIEFYDKRKLIFIAEDSDGKWAVETYYCPSPDCHRISCYFIRGKLERDSLGGIFILEKNEEEIIYERRLFHPRISNRKPIPDEVPNVFANDYKEACLILNDSPKASAALSRRCLQNIIRDVCFVEEKNLYAEIQELLDRKTLPSHIAESIDAIRIIGNFAAHPNKSTATGEIIEVEVGEAEWTLDVLEMMFDFYFVQPEIIRKKKEALNQKLNDAGKPPMK